MNLYYFFKEKSNKFNQLIDDFLNYKNIVLFFIFICFFGYFTEFFVESKIVSRIFYLFSLISVFLIILHFTKSNVLSYLTCDFYRPKLFIYSRITFSIFSLITLFQHVTLYPSGLEPTNNFFLSHNISFVYLISGLYTLALFSLLLGKFIKLSWVLIFFLGGYLIPFSIETFIKIPIIFFSFFIPVSLWRGKINENSWNSSGVTLMFLSLSLLVTCAGLFKLFDPVWLSGYGFYYSFNLPYFAPKILWRLLDYEWIMILFNYFAILIQVLTFPLFLFRKTRALGALFFMLFAIYLTVGMLGIGLVCGPTLLSISPILISWVCGRKQKKTNNKNSSLVKNGCFLILFWWTVLGFYPKVYRTFIKTFANEYPKFGPFKIENYRPPELNNMFYWRNEVLMTLISITRPPMTHESSFVIPLFDYYHLFERYIYNVKFISKCGTILEPVKFFNNDGSIHDNYPFFQNERFLLTCFKISTMRQSFAPTDSKSAVERKTNNIIHELESLIRYCKEELTTKFQIDKAVISIKLLNQPFTFSGNLKPWKNMEYNNFFEKNYISGKSKFYLDSLGFYDFSKLNIEAFKEKKIKPKYYKLYDQ